MKLHTQKWGWMLGLMLSAGVIGLFGGNIQASRAASSAGKNVSAALGTITVNSPLDNQVSEVQQVTVTGVTGSFTLTFNGQTTASMNWDALPSDLESKLNDLSSIGGVNGGVHVSQAGNVYTIIFGGSLVLTDVPQMTATGSGGATVAVATVQNPMPNCPGPNCTLRGAIAAAVSGDTIQFGALFNTPQTITLTEKDLFIEKGLTIQGPGANLLTLNCNRNSRAFDILRGPFSTAPFSGTPFNITISGLTITNGDASHYPTSAFQNIGGAIHHQNSGTMNLVEVFIVNNSASLGGGIELNGDGFTVNLIRSTLSGNAADIAGGVDMSGIGTVNVLNSTIVNNTATRRAGGLGYSVNAPVTLNLVNSTVVGNQATIEGGGLFAFPNATCSFRNSIIALNTAPSSPDSNNFGFLISLGHNLLGNFPVKIPSPTDLLGINPQLAVDGMGKPLLANNGGPTPTVCPLPGSPVIDAGGDSSFNEIQRLFVDGYLNLNDQFTLSFNGQTTAALPINATANQIQTALNALSTIGGVGGTVTVIRYDFFNNGITTEVASRFMITFGGSLGGINLPKLVTGGSAFADVSETNGGTFAPLTTDQRNFARPIDFPNIPNANGGNGSDIGACELILPVVTAVDPAPCTGPGNSISITVQLTNPSISTQTTGFTATLPSGLRAVTGTCTSNIVGASCTISPDQQSVTFSATLVTGQTATIRYQAQVADATTGSSLTITTTPVVSNMPFASVQTIVTVTCAAPGPGGIFPAAAETNNQKAASVLIYNVYTSGATSGNTQNTRINLTNTHPQLPAYVHLFFVAEGCSIADSYLCLTANQTASFLASDLDPGTTGYLVAVAVNQIGCPTSFNYLIGDEYVKFTSGHAANLSAIAFAQIAGGLPVCDGNSVTATLNFDGVSYNRTPAVLALSNVGSRADGNDTLLIVNRIGGNLGIGASTLGTLFGVFYDDAENSLSFSVSGNCQLRNSISNNFPRTTPRFESFIPAGRTGWLKLFSQTGTVGITGSAINFNANANSSAGAFNQGHNLHTLTLTNAASYVIPVFPPSC